MPGLGVVTFVTLFGAYPLVDVPAERINEFGVDAFAPIHADRQLHLTNAHAYVLQKDISALRLSLKFGASVSRATGLITQLQGSGSDGLMQQNYDSPAWGIGPTIEAKAAIWATPAARLTMDLSAAGMLYDRAFPAGGLRYGVGRAGYEQADAGPAEYRKDRGIAQNDQDADQRQRDRCAQRCEVQVDGLHVQRRQPRWAMTVERSALLVVLADDPAEVRLRAWRASHDRSDRPCHGNPGHSLPRSDIR